MRLPIIILCFTGSERNTWLNIKKSQNIKAMIIVFLLLSFNRHIRIGDKQNCATYYAITEKGDNKFKKQ